MDMSTTERQQRNELRTLRAIRGRLEGPKAVAVTGRSAVNRLLAKGLIEVDPEWSGCFRATDAGYDWMDRMDADEDAR